MGSCVETLLLQTSHTALRYHYGGHHIVTTDIIVRCKGSDGDIYCDRGAL